MRKRRFIHFKTCEIFSHTTETQFTIDSAVEVLNALKINFGTRFSDSDVIANEIKIFLNSFNTNIETLALELQMDIIDLHYERWDFVDLLFISDLICSYQHITQRS